MGVDRPAPESKSSEAAHAAVFPFCTSNTETTLKRQEHKCITTLDVSSFQRLQNLGIESPSKVIHSTDEEMCGDVQL